VEFRILGPLEAVGRNGPVELTGGKQKALLALLLLHADSVLPVERIVDDLWGDDVPESARKMVQIFVSHLRKQLPAALIQTRPSGYCCALDGHALDLHRFDALHARGRDALAAGDAEEAADALREALELWRGTPLAEFQEPFAPQERGRLLEQQLACREHRIEADLELGRHTDLVGELDILVHRHPLREQLRGQQMLALYRCGRHAEALESFQRFRRTLRDELGIEPSARLKDLERLMLRQEPTLDLPRREPRAPKPAAVSVDPHVPESRRTVTVLVADVTPHHAPDDPEARRAAAQDLLQHAGDELSRHGARIVPLGAARLLAVFGAPVAQDDDALRAMTAAIGLRARTPSARIGVATGEVVTGDPLVAGAPVDEATLLQERAAPGEVLSGPRTWRAVRHAVTAEHRNGTWSVSAVDADAVAVPRRLETPLVGRERELPVIVEAFERAAAEARPHLVTVFGAPGIGKTRLGIECAERLRARATSVVARCRAGGQETTYAPLRDVIATLADGDAAAWTRKRLGDDVDGHLAEQLNAATGLAAGPAHAEDVALATRRLLTGVARKRPLLLVIEDAHWAAPAFLDLAESLVELVHAPVLVLCLARPDLLDVRPRWGGGRVSSSTIVLDALPLSQAGELLDCIVSGAGLDAERRERILTLAEGNPLFIEQLLAAAVEGEETLPDSIQTLIAARLDRLDDVGRDVVRSAAVIGSSFTADEVEMLVEHDVSASLVTLVRRELIRPGEVGDPGGAGWSFRHSLIRDVAYASIPKRRRAELHELVAALAADHGADGDAFAGFHLDQALRSLLETGAEGPDVDGLRARAAECLRRAGLAAAERADYGAALSMLGRANELLPRNARERIEFLPTLAEMLLWPDGGEAARALLEEAHDVATTIGDARLAARARIAMGSTMMWTDTPIAPEQMLRDIEDAVPVLERHGDHEGLAMAELLRFHALDQAGLPGPEARLPIALAHAQQARAPQVEQRVMGWICITLPHGSVPIQAAIAQVDDIRRASPSAYVHASALGALGLLRAAQGEFEEGRALVRRTRRALEELGELQGAAAHSIAVGEVELLAGEIAAAERVWRKGYDDVTALVDRHSAANLAWRLGLALARRGADDEAEQFAQIAKAARPRGMWVDVWWRIVLALVAAHRGDGARARSLVDDARTRVTSVDGAESAMEADALLESAEALRAAGMSNAAADLAAHAAGIAARLGYVVALRRAETVQRAPAT
jgi:DNA-binding SARP family transcriptional activator